MFLADLNVNLMVKKFISDQKWNNDKCQCEWKNLRKHHCVKNNVFGISVYALVKIVNICLIIQ